MQLWRELLEEAAERCDEQRLDVDYAMRSGQCGRSGGVNGAGGVIDDDPPWPGKSTVMTRCRSASFVATGSHLRRLNLRSWMSATVTPLPRLSYASNSSVAHPPEGT